AVAAVVFAVDVALALRGPSVAAEPADQTRRAPHMDVRRFPRGRTPPRKIPPAPRTRSAAKGAQHWPRIALRFIRATGLKRSRSGSTATATAKAKGTARQRFD